ncbi:MAG: alpha/beta fold hydrolase [Nocardioidaceae bacterium]
MTESATITVRTADDRELEVFVEGPEDGLVLLFHGGTPSAFHRFALLSEAAAERGLRLVMSSRPGYGESTPDPGRSVAAVAADSTAILDTLGADRFVTLGWSGGGPHALACAALLPERCAAAAVLAGVAPYGAEGLDWLGGMGPENVEEFGAAQAGVDTLTPYLENQREQLRDVTSDQVAGALGGLVSDVDKAALTGDFAEYVAGSFRRAVLHGIAGWRDDDLAFAAPWGFKLDPMQVPVAIWQGREDRMVPYDHGVWLADHVAGATSHLYPDEGHVSLIQRTADILDDLGELSALRR